jgi:hypothetical protein
MLSAASDACDRTSKVEWQRWWLAILPGCPRAGYSNERAFEHVAELGTCLDELLNNALRWLLSTIIDRAVVDLETRQVEIELRVFTYPPRGPSAASMP